MGTRQGDLTLLQDPVAQQLLHSRVPARLAYKWLDDSPRVIPIWFHWTGDEVVLGTPPRAPKLKALPANPTVALSIDSDSWPYRVLQIRGTARVEMVEGVIPEYELAAQRYFGPEHGRAWIEQVRNMSPVMGRIAIRPEWVAILDFETRFPSALSG